MLSRGVLPEKYIPTTLRSYKVCIVHPYILIDKQGCKIKRKQQKILLERSLHNALGNMTFKALSVKCEFINSVEIK